MTTEKEYRTNLIEALRSGDYKQTNARLHDMINVTFCCLGVACDLIDPNSWDESLANQGALPPAVRDLYGFKTSDGSFNWSTVPDDLIAQVREHSGLIGIEKFDLNRTSSLSILNDRGVSFDLIADIIESPANLFDD